MRRVQSSKTPVILNTREAFMHNFSRLMENFHASQTLLYNEFSGIIATLILPA